MNKEHCFYDRIDGDWLDSHDESEYDLLKPQTKMLELFLDSEHELFNQLPDYSRERISEIVSLGWYRTSDRQFLNQIKSIYTDFKNSSKEPW